MEKVGRNDPCPCGSGKKYKKCCGKPAAPKKIEATQITAKPESKLSGLFQKKVEKLTPSDKKIIPSDKEES